jgi:hypothetical protein
MWYWNNLDNIMKIHSVSNLITNSSAEVFYCPGDTDIEKLKDIIDKLWTLWKEIYTEEDIEDQWNFCDAPDPLPENISELYKFTLFNEEEAQADIISRKQHMEELLRDHLAKEGENPVDLSEKNAQEIAFIIDYQNWRLSFIKKISRDVNYMEYYKTFYRVYADYGVAPEQFTEALFTMLGYPGGQIG